MLGTREAAFYAAIILVIGIACVVPFSGCGGGGGGGGGGGSADVTGRVLDDGTLAAVPTATVSVSGRQAVTNINGFFVITGVQTGSPAFTISAVTYDTLNSPPPIPLGPGPNDISATPFFLRPTLLVGRGAVSGTVQTLGGAPVGNASVSVQAGGQPFTAKSKTSGGFTVYNVLFGPGSLSAVGSLGEGTYGPAGITVDQPQENVGVIKLTTGPPPPPPFP
ncbi:MAG: hypothetical protein ACE5JM_16990 [Armatimonadota bacterium]